MAEAIKHPEREEKNVLRATIYIQQILMHEISKMSDGALFLRRDLMMLRLPMGKWRLWSVCWSFCETRDLTVTVGVKYSSRSRPKYPPICFSP
ncbi:hypothetical protein QQF64_013997 [Cirrhinus molitorella]|uniref:Uncharacterized protein n=1 Tax=Cirrhinus molitorella TaxID=172907 RepID=A0ABR3LSR3_9TELE